MKAMILRQPNLIETKPLELVDLPKPTIQTDEILIRVKACGICHTDLHTIEGELALPKLPIVPGHQIAGLVEEVGKKVKEFKKGDRVGVPWVYSTCGTCKFCKSDKENLCDNIRFTGFHINGGFAEYMVAKSSFAYKLPKDFSFIKAAPLLCAGIIGYRALKLSKANSKSRLGLYGFGASAHITIQIAIHRGCEIFVFSRSEEHRKLAKKLGAVWVGRAEDNPPTKLDSIIIFAPAGQLVLDALRVLAKGGTIALAGIYMTPIPQIDYNLIYQERSIQSVTNSTKQDAFELLKLAYKIPIRTEIETFPLEKANQALKLLKNSKIQGSGILLND
jgi:propanol-preferring alcohol dehydrogenase